MKKVFIAYADEKMAYSLKRIGRQARSLGIFDDIILWTPKELPQYIKNSPLMQYTYGGGYWAWKPCIIYETLQRYEEGTVVCYVDAGCTLRKGIEWTLWFELMDTYDSLCFHYQADIYEWKKFGTSCTKIKHWTKKETLDFLDAYIGKEEYKEYLKVMGGILFFKGQNNQFVKDWLDITLTHPNIIIDPPIKELYKETTSFARHKHDQCIITALTAKHSNNCIVLPQLFEFRGDTRAISASRIKARTFREYCFLKTKMVIREFICKKRLV